MDAAAGGWLAALAGLGVYDVWLARTGRPMLTDCARCHPIVTGGMFVLLGLHLADRLGRADPFRAVGRMVRQQPTG